MSRNLLLAINQGELRAGDRVLGSLLNSNHPVVARLVDEALGTLPRADIRRFAQHVHGALLAENHSLDCRCPECLEEMLDGIPDTTEQRDAIMGDSGISPLDIVGDTARD